MKITVAIIILVVILVFLNPSYEQFKEHTPEHSDKHHYAVWKKTNDYLIFSIYEKDIYDMAAKDFNLTSSKKYRGFLLNFTPLK